MVVTIKVIFLLKKLNDLVKFKYHLASIFWQVNKVLLLSSVLHIKVGFSTNLSSQKDNRKVYI